MHSPSHPAIPGGGPELRALLVAEAAGAVTVAPGGERGDAGGHEEQLLRESRRGPAGRAQLEAAPRRQSRRHLGPPRSRLDRAGHDGKGTERAPPGGREDGGKRGAGRPLADGRTGGNRERKGKEGSARGGRVREGSGMWEGDYEGGEWGKGIGRGYRERVEGLQEEWIWGKGKGDLRKGFEEGL